MTRQTLDHPVRMDIEFQKICVLLEVVPLSHSLYESLKPLLKTS